MLTSGNSQKCNWCKKLFSLFRVNKQRLGSGQKKYIGPTLTPTRASRLQQMVKSKHSVQKSNLRLIFYGCNDILFDQYVYQHFYFICRKQNIINNLVSELSKKNEAMKMLTDASIQNILQESNLNEPQRTLIQEIISTSKASNLTHRRYSDNWILLCILLHIR